MVTKAVEIEELSVVLSKNIFAIKNLDVSFAKGKVIGLIGPSGAGKTTLIKALVGRQEIENGEILVLGKEAGSRKLRKQISYMAQEAAVYPDLTVKENITYFAQMYGLSRKSRDHQVDVLIKTLDLRTITDRQVGKLSGGQKRRVSLAVSLIGSPKIIVLDEPTVGLDPVLREQIWKLFRELAENGKTVIISSHVMDEAERCDDLVLLRDGMLLAHGTPVDLCNRTNTNNLEQCFLKLVGKL